MRIWRARALGANLWDIGKINIWQVREIPLVTATLAVKRLPPKAPLVPTGRMEDRALRARRPVPATGSSAAGAHSFSTALGGARTGGKPTTRKTTPGDTKTKLAPRGERKMAQD